MRRLEDEPTPAGRGWRFGAIGVVAVLLIGGGWLVVSGLSDGPVPSVPPVDTTRSDSDAAAEVDALDGFAVTPDGAAGAAAAAVAALGRPEVLFDDDRLTGLAAEVFVEAQVRPQVAEVAIARQGFARSGWDDAPPGRRSYFSTPLAVRLVDWQPADGGAAGATVQVWSITVVTIGDTGGAVFTTSTLELTTDDDGRWWIKALDSVEGPTPAVAATPTVPGAYRLWLREVTPTVPTPQDDVGGRL